MSSRSQRTSKRRRGQQVDADEAEEQAPPARGRGATSGHSRVADQNDDEHQEDFEEQQGSEEDAPDPMPAKKVKRKTKTKKARADEGTSSQAQQDPLMQHLQQILAANVANVANVQNPPAPAVVQPQRPGDPVKAVLPRFMQIAVGVSEAMAMEVLAETLAQNPKLSEDTLMWLEEAQIRLACVHEVDAETEALRDAMAHSLAEAEIVRKQQEDEEKRQGPVAAMRKKFTNSKILEQLQKVVCLSLLLQSPSKQSLTKLLTLEKNCLKWYAGHGTILYFNTSASQLHDTYHAAVKTAMQSHGITQQTSTAKHQQAGTSTATTGNHQHKSADNSNPAPLLHCIPPYVPCRICGASSTSEDNPTNSHPAGQGHDSRPAAESATANNNRSHDTSNGPSNEACQDDADNFLQHYPHLAAIFKQLDKELVDKEAYIQEQVSKMPEEQLTTNSSAACTKAYVPPIFRLPENHKVEFEVFECYSDDD